MKNFVRVHKFDFSEFNIFIRQTQLDWITLVSSNSLSASTASTMNNNQTHVQWQDLTPEEQGFYLEFNRPLINNVRQIPANEELIYYGACLPGEAYLNAVCDTGDRLVRTLNFSLTPGQRNAIIAWMAVNVPNHPDPIINHP